MADDAILGNQGDKTPNNEEAFLNEFPDENALDSELPKKEPEKEPKKEEEKKPKKDSSISFQKKKFRERLEKAKEKISSLETKLAEKERLGQPTEDDEKELKAQKLLSKMIRDELKLQRQAEEEEKETLADSLQEELDDAVESSDYAENEILEVMDEYEVHPDKAIKILDKLKTKEDIKKPKLPQSKGGAETLKKEDKPKDEKKSLFQIAQDIKAKMRG